MSQTNTGGDHPPGSGGGGSDQPADDASLGGGAPPLMGLSSLTTTGASGASGATGVAGRRSRMATSPTGTTGILRLNINKPRRSSGSSVEFRTPADGFMQVEPTSPQPSVDRLSVTFAAEERSICSDASVRVNVLPTLAANGYGQAPDGSSDRTAVGLGDPGDDDDEDYSVSMSAIMQRRASTRRSRRKSRRGSHARRPSSPFSPDADSGQQGRRRSSVFTTSSADTAVSVEGSGGGGSGGGEGRASLAAAAVTQEQILENLRVHKEVLSGVKQQPWGMRRKLRLVRQAKTYVKRHEGQLHERFAHSHNTKDIAARFNLWMLKRWQRGRRELANLLNMLIPWELRIKEIESHFGSVVASYFTFLRWLCWVNFVIVVVILAFVTIPEILTADPKSAGERKEMLPEERATAYNLYTLFDFEGPLKYSPLFYGYYTDRDGQQKGYRLPFAYFMTGIAVYVYSFVATLRKMASNSRMSKLSEKEDECVFTWKLFAGWDYMIGNAETAHNRVASTVLGFKEALVEEAEKQREERNWRIVSVRVAVNLLVVGMLASSAYAVVLVVARSTEKDAESSLWRRNETTVVVTIVNFVFPVMFELLGILERYHPRKTLRVQLGRIMALNLINIYTLIFSMFKKINEMSVTSTKIDLLVNGVAKATTQALPLRTLSATAAPCVQQVVTCGVLFAAALGSVTNSSRLPGSAFDFTSPMTPHAATDPSTTPWPVNVTDPWPVNVTDPWPVNVTEPWPVNVTDEVYDVSTDPAVTTTAPPDWAASSTSSSWSLPTGATGSTSVSEDPDGVAQRGLHGLEALSRYLRDAELASEEQTTDWASTGAPTWPDASSTGYYSASSTSGSEPTSEAGDNTSGVSMDASEATSQMTPSRPSSVDARLGVTTRTSSTTAYDLTTLNGDDDPPTSSTLRGTTEACIVTCATTPPVTVGPADAEAVDADAATTEATSLDKHDVNAKRASKYDLNVRRKLRHLCWETMFGQEMVKMTVMDLIMTIASTLFIDFFRAIFVRVMNNCWCWDLEKKFPQYGDFKIAESILHLVNNQGMVWMGMFFSPGLPLINLVKLAVMMYLRSWAVLTCNVPHEVVFRASRSNNFYLALLLTMLFLCVLPVGYAMVRLKPSWHCGPFAQYKRTADIFTQSLRKALPNFLHDALNYMASPGIVIPLLLLLFLVIYYLISLTNSLREANNDLKIQLRRERTEERRKMFQIVDGRRGGGGGDLADKWRRLTAALPSTAGPAGSTDGGKGQNGTTAAKPETSRRKELLARLLKHALRKSSATSDEDSAAQTADPRGRGARAAAMQQPQPQQPLEDGDATDAEQPDCLPEDDEQGQTKVSKRSSRAERAARTGKARSNGGQGIHDAVQALTTKGRTRPQAEPQVQVHSQKPRQQQPQQQQKSWRPAAPSTPRHPHHHHHQRRAAAAVESPSLSSHREREDSVASTWSDNIPEIRISKTESAECVLDADSVLEDSVLEGSVLGEDEVQQAAEPQRASKSGSSDTIVAAGELASRKQTKGNRAKHEDDDE